MAELAVQKFVRSAGVVVMIASVLVALSAAPAFAATVTRAPAISGKATRGSELAASTGDWTPAGANASYDWLRCNASGADCRPISGSCDRRYTVRDPDRGRLRPNLRPGDADGARAGHVHVRRRDRAGHDAGA